MEAVTPCMRCAGPTSIPAGSLVPILCKSCTAGNVLPANPPKNRTKWWRLFRG